MTDTQTIITLAASLITILLGVIAFFLKRLINTIDTVAKEVYDLKSHLRIIEFLEERLKKLENKSDTLEKAFNAVDRWIYAMRDFKDKKDNDSANP